MAVLLPASSSSAQTAAKVAIAPFVVHSKANAALINNTFQETLALIIGKLPDAKILDLKQVAAAMAEKVITDGNAVAIGRNLGATHLLWGTLTEFGELIQVDLRMADVAADKTYKPLLLQAKNVSDLPTASIKIKGEILVRISARQRIAAIRFDGNRTIENSAIAQVIKSAVGGAFSETQLSEDIVAIYKMGYFDDVAVDVDEKSDGKAITFIIKEKGLITDIQFKGHKVIDRKDLDASLSFKIRQTLNQEKVAASVEKIKSLYDNRNYYNAEITYVIEKAGEKDVRIIFTIKENSKLYIKSITFSGNAAYRDKDLKTIMTTSEQGFFYYFNDSGTLKRDQLKQDIAKLNAFYLNHGFIHAHVGEPDISFDKKGIHIQIPITEGKQFKVGKVAITGSDLKVSRGDLLKKLQISKKEFFDRGAVMKDLDELTQACNDEGYAYAEVTPQTTTDEKNQRVDVTFNLFKGHLVYFNRITISGNTKTRDKVIRRMLAMKEGDLYSSSKIKDSYKAMNRTRYFEEVDFQSEKGASDSQTDINIRVKEKATGMFSIGAGYSGNDGLMAMAQVSQQNLFGRGQILTVRGTVGTIAQYYDISFIEPQLFDLQLWSKAEIWNRYRYFDTYRYASKGTGATLGYPLWERVSGFVNYYFATNDLTEIQSTASTYVKRQAGTSTTSSVGFSLYRDSTNDGFFPSEGSRHSAGITYAGGPFGGTYAFTKYNGSTAWYFGLPLDMVFDVKGRIGYLQNNRDGDLPIYERFWLGNINTIRGLRYIGPRDPATNDLIGGNTMMCFNVELVFPLITKAGIKGIVFFDTGNAWDDKFDFGDMRKTAGLGIRWYSPIGPLRLEWGYVLDRKDGEDPARFEFTMGMPM